MASGTLGPLPARPPCGSGRAASRYFFLSYARLPPLADASQEEAPDEWMRACYADLSAAVLWRAAPGAAARPGFLDVELRPGTGWRDGLAAALGSAQVFVPLLSADYYRRSWPRTEWAAFERRVSDAGVAEPLTRFVPVLWSPLPAGRRPPGLAAALALAHGPAASLYTDNGLGALSRMPRYRGCYEEIVTGLAERVVTLAEKAPLPPTPVRLDADAPPIGDAPGGKEFAVLLAGRAAWASTPFAEYARLIAERLGHAVRMGEFAALADELAGHPGVLLIGQDALDGTRDGTDASRDLDELVARLPPWLPPVVVLDQGAGRPAAETTILLQKSHKAYRGRPDIARRGLRGVGSLREFTAFLPYLIAHAEREYLRHSPTRGVTPRPASGPRLASLREPAAPPVKENFND